MSDFRSIYWGILFCLLQISVWGQRSIPFQVVVNDTMDIRVNLNIGLDGKPYAYSSYVFTPVCYTNECKPVHVVFHWDLLGNYVRYEVPEGEEFTKMDHESFQKEDYEKMSTILKDRESILKTIEIQDLITEGTDNLADSVDAKTGATLKTIKDGVIEGAVYTCFTLWHLAHHPALQKAMLERTEDLVNDDLLNGFLSSKNHFYHYWALDRVVDKENKPLEHFWPAIKKAIEGENVFASKKFLDRLSPHRFSSSVDQKWLLELFQKSSFTLQLTILEKLIPLSLNEEVLVRLVPNFQMSNPTMWKANYRVFESQKQLARSVKREITKVLHEQSIDRQLLLEQILKK